MYFRLFAFQLLGVTLNRLLYLDADVLVAVARPARMHGIDALHRIHIFRKQPDFGNVILLPERMRMAYNAAALMYQRVLFFDRCILNLRMRKQPCPIQSVYQKLRPLITCFPSQEYRKPDAVPLCLCMLISETEAPYPLLPRQGTVHLR